MDPLLDLKLWMGTKLGKKNLERRINMESKNDWKKEMIILEFLELEAQDLFRKGVIILNIIESQKQIFLNREMEIQLHF
jgi:hypothetical protein